MRHYKLLIFILFIGTELTGQTVRENLSGQVSFVSSQNIYVKFRTTEGISKGDTLFIKSGDDLIPALLVTNLSSSSCVCSAISSNVFSVADLLIARSRIVKKEAIAEAVKPAEKDTVKPEVQVDSVKKSVVSDSRQQKIRGSISLNSYTDNSNTLADNSQRFRYTFSIDARNIANSKFSAESYISFKHKIGDWQEVKDNLFNALKIYSVSAKYDLNKTTRISLGRKINPMISSIGAIDGLQFEKSLKGFTLGAIAGSRPDFANYGFDLKLFQYGAYAAYNSGKGGSFTETSLAFMQQTKSFKTDRRFLYFQHSNSIIKNLNFFSTIEADLYRLNIDTVNHTEKAQSTFSLTGFYISLNYRAGSRFSLSGSYDARKNVMYYETYKTFIDRILEDQLRQGFRVQSSLRITNDMILGLQAGYRFLKSDPHISKNFNGYFTYSRIPGIGVSATLSATLLQSGFLSGKIFSLNLSRDLFKGKVQTGIGYRYVDYRLPENLVDLIQNIGEASFSWQISKSMAFSLNYEGTFEKQDRYNRIYLQLRKRF